MAAHLDVAELILRIHAAALEENGWERIGTDICRALGASGAGFVRPTVNPNIAPWVQFVNVDPAAAVQYNTAWGRYDIWYLAAVRAGRTTVGLINRDDQLVERRAFLQSPFYNEYLKPLDIARLLNVVAAPAEPATGQALTSLSFYRGVGKEPFSTAEAQLLSDLTPHLRVMTHNYWAARSLLRLSTAQTAALNAMSSAVFALDCSGRVLYANQAGEELIRQERWVKLNKGGLAPGGTLVDGARIAAALRRVCSGVGCKLLATDRGGAQAYISAAGVPPTASVLVDRRVPSALVWVTPIAPPGDTSDVMARLFGLTPAEKRLLGRLIAGDEPREAAAALCLRIHTVRTQLRSIFRKTGKHRQSELLVLASRAAMLSPGDSADPAPKPYPVWTRPARTRPAWTRPAWTILSGHPGDPRCGERG
jgi:DNA-binding CsgD family transcriptional regulator/PAS domain-containing protein